MWKTMRVEGFVELEQEYARLLRNVDGKKWQSMIVPAVDGNPWEALKGVVPTFFSANTHLNFIGSAQGDVRFVTFPQDATEAEIHGNLQLKRKDYFNAREDLLLKTRSGPLREDKTRDVLVSYLPKVLYDEAKNLCQATGMSMGRLATSADTLFGTLERQRQGPSPDTCIVLQIGYSRVHMLAVRGVQIISARTLLTGCVRELENALLANFSLPRENTHALLNGSMVTDIPAIEDAIRDNRKELMTYVGSLLSELRGKKLISETSIVYMNNSVVAEPQLASVIAERFGISVEYLTGMLDDEFVEAQEHAQAIWLCGAVMPMVTNLAPTVSGAAKHLAVPPRLGVIAALVLAAAPLPFLNILKMRSERELSMWKERHLPVESIDQGFKAATMEQERLAFLAKEITADIDRRGFATRLARHITEELPPYSRLETVEVDLVAGRLLVVGFTVDAETALRYLDRIKAFPDLNQPELSLGDVESRRIKFEISATVVKKA